MQFRHRRRWIGLVAACVVLAYGAFPTASSVQKQVPKAPRTITFTKDVKPFLDKHCIQCHGANNPKAGLSLVKYKSEEHVRDAREIWNKVAQNVASKHMPPAVMPQPSKAERDSFIAWVSSTLNAECDVKEPGRVTMRRMNRHEYDNTVRDLIGLDLKLAVDFPSDDVGYGFDNIGDVLSISPLHMEKYLKAAETISQKAILLPKDQTKVFPSSAFRAAANGQDFGDSFVLASNGDAFVSHRFPTAGKYSLQLDLSAQQAGPENAKAAVLVDGKEIRRFEVTGNRENPQKFDLEVEVGAGEHRLGVRFLNDFYEAGNPPKDRNLFVHRLEVKAPEVRLEELPDSHRRIISEMPKSEAERRKVARHLLGRFATRAFRRPVESSELDRLIQLTDLVAKDGEPFERQIQLAVQAVLSSPHFLFKVEADDGKPTLGPYELASRLSYFLWSSMPDDRLLEKARTGEILKDEVLSVEAKRMLKDPRAASLGEDFAAQWLNLRKLPLIQPDPKMFPGFSESLRQDMMTETRMFFDAVVKEDRSILDFLGGQFTYLNERLAKHYEIPNVTGNEFRRVSLAGTPRAGLLTQASILTLTSNPTRTSPVKRGKWVLDQLLNQPPPPPPPGVADLTDDHKVITGKTLRQRMEQHRADPTCASCHQRMDPIGFSLENFDVTGKWRKDEGGSEIDATGVLPDGTKFAGPEQLKKILLDRKKLFVESLSDKMLTFAIGRGLEFSDKCYVEEIARHVEKNDHRFVALVAAVVRSEPFRSKSIKKGASK